MEENLNPINESANTIRILWEKHGIKKPMRFLGFCLSLLPIPVIQQAGQALDRHMSDKDLNKELDTIWKNITKINTKIDSVETLEEAIAEIAKSVSNNTELLTKAKKISYMLSEKESIFIIETKDRSYQELVGSIVEASQVRISSTNASTNLIEDTEIYSPNTYLHASGESKNYINKTYFMDKSGSIGMNGITTKGDIHITGNSVGFGKEGTLIFGKNHNLVKGECPICHNTIKVDKRLLTNYSNILCPYCNNILPFKIG